jgi:hypothetical protein
VPLSPGARCGSSSEGSEAVWCCLVLSIDRWFGFVLFPIRIHRRCLLSARLSLFGVSRLSPATSTCGDGSGFRHLAFPDALPSTQHQNPSEYLRTRTENPDLQILPVLEHQNPSEYQSTRAPEHPVHQHQNRADIYYYQPIFLLISRTPKMDLGEVGHCYAWQV